MPDNVSGIDTTLVICTNRGRTVDNLIIVFLLFAAVLAFGWFYLQRAKARDAAKASTGPRPTDEPPAATPDEPPA